MSTTPGSNPAVGATPSGVQSGVSGTPGKVSVTPATVSATPAPATATPAPKAPSTAQANPTAQTNPTANAANWTATKTNNFITLVLTPDKMRALMTLVPQANPTQPLTMMGIIAAGAAVGLKPEVFNAQALGAWIEKWNKTREPKTNVIVAESPKPPKPGKDSRVEWLVKPSKPEPTLTPATTDATGAGSPPAADKQAADLREVKEIIPVTKGQQLVRLHPSQPGVEGINLLGEKVPAPSPKLLAFRTGEGVEAMPGDGNLYVASRSGYLKLAGGRVEVQECYQIPGDVDYSTGNVRYDRSAAIAGDVQDGFVVAVGGDLEVGGTISDCKVTVGGSLVVKGGFQGKGQGIINVKGNVHLGFCGNQVVRAYGPIDIDREAYTSQVLTRKSLSVNGALVGGRAIALDEIRCGVVGNDMGTVTLVEVGVDYVATEALQDVEKFLKEYEENLNRAKTRANTLKEAYLRTGQLDSDCAREVVILREAIEKLQTAIPALQARKGEMVSAQKLRALNSKPTLRVEKMVYAGVTLKIGIDSLKVTENIVGPKLFAIEGGRIKVY